MNESATCREYVRPMLESAGWDDDKHPIIEQKSFTDGRIVPIGHDKIKRRKQWHARWNSKGQYRKPHILYLSDRNILVDDPKIREFTAFDKEAIYKIEKGQTVNSMTEFKQIIGRGTRVRDDYGKYFFNILDDMEQLREDEAAIAGERFQPAIEPPYRWRDWTDHLDTLLTGDGLIAFINNEEAIRPGGTRGAGLFTYLRNLQGANINDRRNIIATVFRGTVNRRVNGYLLAQMNLLLHGLESPQIDHGNSLRFPLREIGDRQRIDIILTNPPFGGEEERGILSNFPADKQTSETALLFLQHIMRKLKRPPTPGRTGIVIPNSTLFGDGVCARIKEELLKDFNLLFFHRSGPTRWILGLFPVANLAVHVAIDQA